MAEARIWQRTPSAVSLGTLVVEIIEERLFTPDKLNAVYIVRIRMVYELPRVVVDVDKDHFFHVFLLLSLGRRPWRWVIVVFRHFD